MLIFAAASPSPQPDYVALAMVFALALCVAVMAVRKHLAGKKTAQAEPADAPAVRITEAAPQTPAAPGSAGRMKLYDVEPKTAAMLMAIVADKMGKPLNELRFISVKEVK